MGTCAVQQHRAISERCRYSLSSGTGCQVERDSALDAIVRALRKIDFHGRGVRADGRRPPGPLRVRHQGARAARRPRPGHRGPPRGAAEPVHAARSRACSTASSRPATCGARPTRPIGGASSSRSCPSACPRSARPWSRSARPTPIVVAAYSDDELELINDFLSKMADAERGASRGRPRDAGGLTDEGVHSAPLGAIEPGATAPSLGRVGPVARRRSRRRHGALPGALRRQAAEGPRARRHRRRRLSRRHARDHRLAQAGRQHRAEPDDPVDGRGPWRDVEGRRRPSARSSCARSSSPAGRTGSGSTSAHRRASSRCGSSGGANELRVERPRRRGGAAAPEGRCQSRRAR